MNIKNNSVILLLLQHTTSCLQSNRIIWFFCIFPKGCKSPESTVQMLECLSKMLKVCHYYLGLAISMVTNCTVLLLLLLFVFLLKFHSSCIQLCFDAVVFIRHKYKNLKIKQVVFRYYTIYLAQNIDIQVLFLRDSYILGVGIVYIEVSKAICKTSQCSKTKQTTKLSQVHKNLNKQARQRKTNLYI